MRPGFFCGDAGPAPPPPPPARPHAPQQQQPQPPSPAAQLADVLDLCRGPTDERRLVGLLLATKLLPALAAGAGGGDDAGTAGTDAAAATAPLRAVCDAVGLEFMERLMLPLSQPDGGGVEVSCVCVRARSVCARAVD